MGHTKNVNQSVFKSSYSKINLQNCFKVYDILEFNGRMVV